MTLTKISTRILFYYHKGTVNEFIFGIVSSWPTKIKLRSIKNKEKELLVRGDLNDYYYNDSD